MVKKKKIFFYQSTKSVHNNILALTKSIKNLEESIFDKMNLKTLMIK